MSLTVSVFAHHENDPQIDGLLIEFFADLFGSEFPISTPTGHDIVYRAYLDNLETAEHIKSAVERCLNAFTNIRVDIDTINDLDWQTAWQAHFVPFNVGTKLYITVPWDKAVVPADRLPIIIDPGMAFGTGNHSTTAGCLYFLDKLVKPGISVVDWGTGSAILAIAAAKLGATTVLAFDNDPDAIEPARSNVVLNGVENSITLAVADGSEITARYDLIVANITADIHLQLFSQYKKISSTWILSGISDFRKSQMDLFLGIEGVAPIEVWEKDGWYTYLFQLGR